MARTEKFYVGPKLLGEIRDTITRVAGMPNATRRVEQPVRLQDMPRPAGGGGGLYLGKVTAVWNKNSIQDVILHDQGDALQESAASPSNKILNCVNKLIRVPAGKFVIIGKIQSRWYLVNSECG